MKYILSLILAATFLTSNSKDVFPDGTPVPDWFRDTAIPEPGKSLPVYTVTDYGVVNDSTILQTEKIQGVIDLASENGGGVIRIPEGVFLSGSLFFKPGTHLSIEENGKLKGSDDISNFKLTDTRIEGQNLKYFSALVNAIGVDGFTISGKGTIDGNGLRYWKSFWLRREYNKDCTNLEEMRPRLVFISDCNNVTLSGVHLQNSPFWTTHLYRSNNVKLLNLTIFAPKSPVKAPSSDAVDIDVCQNVLIKNCYMSVNDDAVALKGGKGPWADRDTVNNGENRNIIIEDCVYGFCHSALTCGSESIHNYNIILRRCRIDNAQRLLWLKMRRDTPQNYEYIAVEGIKGSAKSLLYAKPWTQFFDLKGRKDAPMSFASNVTMKNIEMQCVTAFDVVKAPEQYILSDFTFEDWNVKASKNVELDRSAFEGVTVENVIITED